MRSPILLAPVAALALLAGCGDSDDEESTKLTFDSPPLELQVVDNDPQGPSVGDTHVFSGELLEQGSDEPVGRLDGTGTVTAFDQRGGEQVDLRASIVQFTFDDGSIVVGGVLPGPSREAKVASGGVTRPILGGTGKYQGASGVATLTSLPDGELRHVFEIETDD